MRILIRAKYHSRESYSFFQRVSFDGVDEGLRSMILAMEGYEDAEQKASLLLSEFENRDELFPFSQARKGEHGEYRFTLTVINKWL